jgi:hypothetical protein
MVKTNTDMFNILHISSDNLTKLYFSNDNIELLQEEIIKYVYYHTEIKIGKQSYEDLQIIMMANYNLNKNKLTGHKNILDQVKYLNRNVILESAKIIINNLEQYKVYRSNINQSLNILPHPEHVSSAGSRSNELKELG